MGRQHRGDWGLLLLTPMLGASLAGSYPFLGPGANSRMVLEGLDLVSQWRNLLAHQSVIFKCVCVCVYEEFLSYVCVLKVSRLRSLVDSGPYVPDFFF